MTSTEKSFHEWRCRLKSSGMFLLFFAVAIVLQVLGGAFRSEFGSEPDEAAHYVTGLMVRDYVAAGFPEKPFQYAKEYYNHYPKVSLGHWPPGFYLIQSAWSLFLSPSRVSMLLLMAALAALVALALYRGWRPDFGEGAAIAGGLTFLALPLVQKFSGAIMTEIPMTLLILVAVVFWGKFLERERRADAVVFGLLASAAILTKTSGLLLSLVPPLSLLFTRQFYLLKRVSFWLPALIVVVLAGPWTIATLDLMRDGIEEQRLTWAFTSKAIPYYAAKLYGAVGAGIFILAFAGALTVVPVAARVPEARKWAAFAALIIGVFVFVVLVPAGREARHLLPALPAVVAFAVAGAMAFSALLVQRGLQPKLAGLVVFGLAAVMFFGQIFEIPQKGYAGFRRVVIDLAATAPVKSILLVSSDARGEGMLIAEVAMLDERRPGRVVRRASKSLARSSWSGKGYAPLFSDEDELVSFLRRQGISYLVIDHSVPAHQIKEHHQLLWSAVQRASFELLNTYDLQRAGTWHTNAIHVYRTVAKQGTSAPAL